MDCPIKKQCGSCQYIGMDYSKQLSIKKEKCEKLFPHQRVHDVAGMQNPYFYRNKVIVAFNQKYEYGLYEETSHRIVPMKACLLHDEQTHLVLTQLQKMLKKYRVSIYDENRNRGFLRHVLIRRAVTTNQTLVVLVGREAVMKGSKNFCQELVKACPSVQSVVLNINNRQTSIVLSKQEKILYGKGFIVDKLCGLTFKISAQSFYQINHEQCTYLYHQVLSLLDLHKNDVILDTYCGIGTIGMFLAQYVDTVIGVELNHEAYKDAINNAKMNKIHNIHFVHDDATHFMVELAKQKQKIDCVIMDPPRAGSTQAFIESIKVLQPRQVIYVSCDPSTQARDLKMFNKIGYKSRDVYPVDMFPHTNHVETVCLLTREKSVKSYAYVDITPSELGMGGKVKKPTYKQIQAYVLETHGLKVSPLYIANVKDAFGLEKQFSYEEAGMSAKKRPNCPPEKRAAIIDALIHFGMLDEDARETE